MDTESTSDVTTDPLNEAMEEQTPDHVRIRFGKRQPAPLPPAPTPKPTDGDKKNLPPPKKKPKSGRSETEKAGDGKSVRQKGQVYDKKRTNRGPSSKKKMLFTSDEETDRQQPSDQQDSKWF